MKKILKNKYFFSILAWLLHKYCLFSFYTSKVVFPEKNRLEEIFANHSPSIFAFWHGRMCLMPFFTDDPEKFCVMISHHGDGALIAKIMDFFGINQVRGSSNRIKTGNKGAKDRGGSSAFRESLDILSRGSNLVITPDGPRGPRMRAQMGVVQLAKLSGKKIIPISLATSHCKIINSWDRFMLPLPFGRIYVALGTPVTVPSDANEEIVEKCRIELENQLNGLTRDCDIQAGIFPIEPAQKN